MAETITLYHPDLKETTQATEKQARVLEKSGWKTDVPKKYQDTDEKKEG